MDTGISETRPAIYRINDRLRNNVTAKRYVSLKSARADRDKLERLYGAGNFSICQEIGGRVEDFDESTVMVIDERTRVVVGRGQLLEALSGWSWEPHGYGARLYRPPAGSEDAYAELCDAVDAVRGECCEGDVTEDDVAGPLFQLRSDLGGWVLS